MLDTQLYYVCKHFVKFPKKFWKELYYKKKGYPLLLKITKFQNMVNKKNIGDFCNVRCKAVTV
jgi:hypothetical protein